MVGVDACVLTLPEAGCTVGLSERSRPEVPMTQVCLLELALDDAKLQGSRRRQAQAQAACRFPAVTPATAAPPRATGVRSERLGSIGIRSPPYASS
jgi:hypothetical protein